MRDTGGSSANSAGWPAEVLPVFQRFITCEYATLTRAGAPVTLPLTPYLGEDGRTLDVSTGITYPAKAERVRRNPRVCMLFSDPAGSRVKAPPVVLVYGLAAVDDHDLQAVVGRCSAHHHAALTRIERDITGVETAPVGVVRAREPRPRVVFGRLNGAGDEGVPAVGSDHDPRSLDLAAAPDPDDGPVLEDELIDRRARANLGAGFGGCLDEQLVEHGAARSVSLRNAVGRRR